MLGKWSRGLTTFTHERYPALLSYATMLTPDLDEAHELTDAAISRVMGALRPPRDDWAREGAIHDAMARGYAQRYGPDHEVEEGSAHSYPADAPGTHADVYAPAVGTRDEADDSDADADFLADAAAVHVDRGSPAETETETETDNEHPPHGLGVADTASSMATALATLSPIERVAALAWWVDGLSADEVAARIGFTSTGAVFLLHRAGLALSRANGTQAPAQDHFLGTGDVVTVEVSHRGRRR
jgi:DNA-directed RNA polymerase specialized sigma24 family protein